MFVGGGCGMSVHEALVQLLGEIPPQYEILYWFMSFWILFYLISSAFSILASIINWIGGRS